ncbi:MAG: hypothetical protein ACRDHD_03190 [Candidatus Limnocylindria bacterium]
MGVLAYIDPGSGSLLLQALLAGLLAIPFFFRRTISDFWHRVRGTREDAAPAAPPSDGSERSDR